MNLGQIRANVRANLSDAGITFYDDDSINQSIQDAYNEVACKCYCIIKSATINQVAQKNYYDFITLGVSDYFGTLAIFNNDTQFWLRDDLSIRDYDRLRRDWELWAGAPQFWVPHSQQYVAITPKLMVVNGETFTLWYWAQAPNLLTGAGQDSNVPLIATDMQSLLEKYATADMLENAEEITKALTYSSEYEVDKIQYKTRCIMLAKTDLLLRI